ncbi:MAG: glycosyltransferase family 2 protein, partial [Bacteroidales bacterium]|nr:glycosyltransferase family 2 protein [Bacteroidales bacterium]
MSERICVIIPTYNNAGTLKQVLDGVLKYSNDVIVVNDGSTDGTAAILNKYAGSIDTLILPKNRGKGAALKAGFDLAVGQGYTSAVTIDADGQHLPSDLPAFFEAAEKNPGAMIVGTREDLAAENKSGGSTFANRFSNFWFTIQTFVRLKDTQCGYRLYPLKKISSIKFLTSRYEAELELLVFMAWRGARFVQLPVTVLYPEDRVSHFRPFADFARIS